MLTLFRLTVSVLVVGLLVGCGFGCGFWLVERRFVFVELVEFFGLLFFGHLQASR